MHVCGYMYVFLKVYTCLFLTFFLMKHIVSVLISNVCNAYILQNFKDMSVLEDTVLSHAY